MGYANNIVTILNSDNCQLRVDFGKQFGANTARKNLKCGFNNLIR